MRLSVALEFPSQESIVLFLPKQAEPLLVAEFRGSCPTRMRTLLPRHFCLWFPLVVRLIKHFCMPQPEKIALYSSVLSFPVYHFYSKCFLSKSFTETLPLCINITTHYEQVILEILRRRNFRFM
jgi:hypothetical protein